MLRNNMYSALVGAFLVACSADKGEEAQTTENDQDTVKIMMADFEGNARQAITSRMGYAYELAHNIPAESSQTYWGVIGINQTFIHTAGRDTLYTAFDVFAGAPQNIGKALESGYAGKSLHVIGTDSADGTPWIGVGAAFTGMFQHAMVNLCSLQSIRFMAKGSGSYNVKIITDTVYNGYSSDSNWGHFGADVDLDNTWREYVVAASALKAPEYSPQLLDNLVWEDGCQKSMYLQWTTSSESSLTTEIWLDNIVLLGVDSTDFQNPED